MKIFKTLSIYIGICGVLFTSCGRAYTDTTLYEKNGQTKPIVVVMPCLIKNNDLDIGWDLSKEFTDELRRRVYESPKLYLEKGNESLEIAKALATPDPRAIPSAPLKDLESIDYVIVTELVEQRQTPYGFPSLAQSKAHLEESGAILNIALRVRVLDCRRNEPRVILQELVESSQVVAKPYLSSDYQKVIWGTEPFHNTPLGLAHSKVLREAIGHIEGYILASK